MRLRKRVQQKLQLKKKSTRKDSEGNVFPSYSGPINIYCEVWPATSKIQIELYGNRIAAIMNVISDKSYNIEVDDLVVYGEKSYLVISKREYSNHNVYEMEQK